MPTIHFSRIRFGWPMLVAGLLCGAIVVLVTTGDPFGTDGWFQAGGRLFVSASATEKQEAESAQKGGESPSRDVLLRRFVAEFIPITPGKGKFPAAFRMGSKENSDSSQPRHEVRFDGRFSMARHEVPQDLYEAVMKENPSLWGGPRNAVEMVSFLDAQRFCARATAMLRRAELIEANEVIRLPSEAEWEYCCRAGTTTAYSFGDAARAESDRGHEASWLDAYAWHTGNAAGNDPPVGELEPNAWGLYDMHGYLWEFVADSWHPNYDGAPADGRAWEPAAAQVPRVIRGGSWRDRYDLLTSATRWSIPAHARSDAIGFRCVRAERGKR